MHIAPISSVPGSIVLQSESARPEALQTPRLAGRTMLRTRPARVCWLILAIAVLSIADLHMTLVHLTTIGLSEGNPVARLVMSSNSPAILIAWKLASVSAACLAFYAGRKKLVGEVAAWFCCAVLIWLTLRWSAYSTELASICPQVHMLHQADAGLWVTMTP